MKLIEAINRAQAMTGNSRTNEEMTQWLSELDGRLMLDFFHASGWAEYHTPEDDEHELLVPFPWDDMYIHWLEAKVYYSNGEMERYTNAMVMFNSRELDYRKWYQRQAVRICPKTVQTRDVTIVTTGRACQPFWYLSAYAIACKHGFTGSENEWLEGLRGDKVILQYFPDEGIKWKYSEDEGGWQTLLTLPELQGQVVSDTLAAAEESKTASAASAAAADRSAQDAAGSAETAAGSANSAKSSATSAAESAAGADKSEAAAAASAQTAEGCASAAGKSAADAAESEGLAATAASRAEGARAAIEGMTVDAESVEPGQEATAEKTTTKESFHIHFKIPKGDKGEPGAIELGSGMFALQVLDGYLHLYYWDGDDKPPVTLREDGYLVWQYDDGTE